MSSTADAIHAFVDFVEVTDFSSPVIVAEAFGTPGRSLARAIQVFGGGDIVLLTAAGYERTLTDVGTPFFFEVEFSKVMSVTAATKVILMV